MTFHNCLPSLTFPHKASKHHILFFMSVVCGGVPSGGCASRHGKMSPTKDTRNKSKRPLPTPTTKRQGPRRRLVRGWPFCNVLLFGHFLAVGSAQDSSPTATDVHAYLFDYTTEQLGMLLRQQITGSAHQAYDSFPWWRTVLGLVLALTGLAFLLAGFSLSGITSSHIHQRVVTIRHKVCLWHQRPRHPSRHKVSLSDDDWSDTASLWSGSDEEGPMDENSHRMLHFSDHCHYRYMNPKRTTNSSERGTAASQSRRRRWRRRAFPFRPLIKESQSWRGHNDDDGEYYWDFFTSSYDPLLHDRTLEVV